MPHVLGNAGGPPPATRNEILLREAVDRLRVELDECRSVINHISVLLDTSPIGPTRADLAGLAFEIRQAIDTFREADAKPGGASDG
jgi:hypothetical protein